MIPAEALRAAAHAMAAADRQGVTWADMAKVALEAAAPHMTEDRQNEIQAEVLIHAMSVISQALATAEKWRYDRVCADFQEMIDAAQAGKLRKP